jgi:gliding motility-associated lipoprotein GldD
MAALAVLFFSGMQSCKEEPVPKPRAQLRLEYEDPEYKTIDTNCPFRFLQSNATKAVVNDKCWVNLEYPELRASINMTYRPVQGNLEELLREAEKLTFNHSIKADGISSRPYANKDHKVYGSVFEVTGNAASPVQFHVTDSLRHFITGAVYFDVQPNYDSIRPAIQHIEKDIVKLIESLEWTE